MTVFGTLFQMVSAFLAVVAVGVLLYVPRKYLLYAGIVGALGWLVDMTVREFAENPMLAAFFAAFFVAVLSQLFARLFKAPVTVFLVSGILPLVPGVGMYRMVYYLLKGEQSLSSYYFSYTLQIAGMIALAIFVVDSFFKILYRKRK